MQKKEKKIGNSQSYAKNSGFWPPYWIDPPFLANLTKYVLDQCCWRKYKLIAKNRTQNVGKFQSFASLNFSRHLVKKKQFFHEICVIKTKVKIKKTERKNVQNSLIYGKKIWSARRARQYFPHIASYA
jgi:hypothetical protein